MKKKERNIDIRDKRENRLIPTLPLLLRNDFFLFVLYFFLFIYFFLLIGSGGNTGAILPEQFFDPLFIYFSPLKKK